MRTQRRHFSNRHWVSLELGLSLVIAALAGCAPSTTGGNNSDPNNNENDNTAVGDVTWGRAFDGFYTGALTSIWGADANNVFAVGGQTNQCEAYRFDGTEWQAMAAPAGKMILAWVFGFSASDVFAVGEGGGVMHYDGSVWTALDSGTDEDLWGVWGTSSSDLWIVGGETRDENPPVILHYDGTSFTRVDPPSNDRNATALFGVYGVGNKVFAVGSLGLIIQRDSTSGTWSQIDSGPAANQDFLNIYGTREDHFVAVGGRAPSGGRISIYDGSTWDTFEPDGVSGLSTVFTGSSGRTLVGGPDGYVAILNTADRTLSPEFAGASDSIRGIWGPATSDLYFVVGGNFAEPHTGVAVLRSLGAEGRVGVQADRNGDGLPDAPLTMTGEPPDDIVIPSNDNSAPSDAEVVFAYFDPGGPFEVIEEGGDIALILPSQSEVYVFNPVIRVYSFPAEATNKFVVYSYTIRLASSGALIGEGSEVRPIGAALDSPGALDLFGNYKPDESFMPDDLVGQTIELSVTVTYDAVSPPATSTITQTMFVSEVIIL